MVVVMVVADATTTFIQVCKVPFLNQYLTMHHHHPVLNDWLSLMNEHKTSNTHDHPSYYLQNIEELITTSRALSFNIGTGEQLFRDISPSIASAEFEVLIVTCFYAKSQSQVALASALQELSARAGREHRKVRVRICFSSVSLSICHRLSRFFSGSNDYPPSCWEELFGFSPDKLKNLDLYFRSIFILPLSVMHPKFIVVDGKHAFLPSCNISWENWFEGCIELEGGIVTSLIRFWEDFWGKGDLVSLENTTNSTDSSFRSDQHLIEPDNQSEHPRLLSNNILDLEDIQTIFLPSPHHTNPKFRLVFPAASPPSTPLNMFLLTCFRKARKSIYIQSPNITSSPVLSALYKALNNGVNVKIVTSTRMMLLEQLITAGTITEISLANLQRGYNELLEEYKKDSQSHAEAGRPKPGLLSVDYYTAKDGSNRASEPVKSHLKLTIVDEEVVVLGSGNSK